VAAQRPVHPLGKCSVTTSLLTYVITSKYADGLPLYRFEKMLKRLGHEVSRTNMAHWVIRRTLNQLNAINWLLKRSHLDNWVENRRPLQLWLLG